LKNFASTIKFPKVAYEKAREENLKNAEGFIHVRGKQEGKGT